MGEATPTELRVEGLAEEAAQRPSTRMALGGVGVWLAVFVLMGVVLPRARVSGLGGAFVLTLSLDPGTVPVCALFLCALGGARIPGGPGLAARDFVRLALGLGLLIGASIPIQLLAAWVVGGQGRPDGLATALVLFAALLGVASGLGLLLLALVWLAVAHEVALLPRGEPRQEVARVAHVSAPALVAVALWTSYGARHLASSPLVVIPAPLAVALTLSGVVVALALWLRLRQPMRGSTE